MLKLRVSYKNEKDLQEVINRFRDKKIKVKIPKEHRGKFKKAYIEFKE